MAVVCITKSPQLRAFLMVYAVCYLRMPLPVAAQ